MNTECKLFFACQVGGRNFFLYDVAWGLSVAARTRAPTLGVTRSGAYLSVSFIKGLSKSPLERMPQTDSVGLVTLA